MNSRLIPTAAPLLLLAATLVHAQSGGSYPGRSVDSATLNTQEQVESLFQSGDYDRAYIIYRDELAPIGDKYAQYMVGFMHLTGTGVGEDPVLASAWYRLAAERQYPEFMAVRDEVLASMTPVDRVLSDRLYLELRARYSDVVLLLELIRDDLKSLSPTTGSRLSGGASAVTIVDMQSGTSLSADEHFRRIKIRIESRLRELARQLDADDIRIDADRIDMDALEERVQAYVETLSDRDNANPDSDGG